MDKIQKITSSLYQIGGKPLILSPSQIEIFKNIYYKTHPLNITIAFTRYGKSLTTALAVLTRCLFYPEKWAIIAPTEKQAKIIMNYIIDHIFDNEFIISKLQVEEGESLERLRRERSKSRITLKVYNQNAYSEIYILSAHSTKEDPLKSLLGFGAENIILDESALIDDKVYVGILRMLGDSPHPFLFELGNPIKRNHFFDSYNNPKYYKTVIDYHKGLEEGRITQDQIDLMKDKYGFDVLYECKFPPVNADIVPLGTIDYTNQSFKDCDMFAIGTDLAISEKDTSDFSAICVAGRVKDTNKIRVIDSISGHWTPNEMINLVVENYRLYSQLGPVMIGVEDVGYQRSFADELERRFLLAPVLVKRTVDKKSRLLMLNPYFSNRQIEFMGNQSKFSTLTDQLLNWGSTEHDDEADAFEMAVSLLKEYMIKTEKPPENNKDPEKAMIEEAIQQLKNQNPKYYEEGEQFI